MENAQNGLSVKNLEKIYAGGYTGLARSDLYVGKGEILSVYGGRESGKSTLLRVLAGLERASAGEAFLNGKDLLRLELKDRGVAFTAGCDSLNKRKSVYFNLAYPLLLRDAPKDEIRKKVSYMASKFYISDILDTRVGDISDGQRARLLLARSLTRDCELYLLDNPLAAIYGDERKELFSTLSEVMQNLTGTVVYATDDFSECGVADRTTVLYANAVEQTDRLCRMRERPASLYVARLIEEDLFVFEAAFCRDGIKAFGRTREVCAKPISDVYYDKTALCALTARDVTVRDGGGALVTGVFHRPERDVLSLSVDGVGVSAYCEPYAFCRYQNVGVEFDFKRARLFDVHSEKNICR